MAISLTKGQKTNLTKENPDLKKIIASLGWDDESIDFDLDISAFLLNAEEKVTQDEDFIFYNNMESKTKAVIHTGSSKTDEGHNETIMVDFSKIPSNVEKIPIIVTIHEAGERQQNFGQISTAFIKIINEDNGEEILRYDLTEDFSIETAIIIAELYKSSGEWKFRAVGSGFRDGLNALCRNFGVNV